MNADLQRRLLQRLSGQQDVITVKRVYIEITGSLKAALMLGQLLFWSGTRCAQKREGWIYKSYRDWWDEIALTKNEAEGATRKLRELGIIETTTRRPAGRSMPVMHYRICWTALEQALAQIMDQNDGVTPEESPTSENQTVTSENQTVTSENQKSYTDLNLQTLTTDLKKRERVRTRTPAPARQGKIAYSQEFEEAFWQPYPLKRGKADAYRLWCRMQYPPELVHQITASIQRHLEADPNWTYDEHGQRFIPNPATYLYQERWTDVIPDPPSRHHNGHRHDTFKAKAHAILAELEAEKAAKEAEQHVN
jgi:hypothetical protein